MSADIKKIKELRDRFLAFAFASADLFLEVDEAGLVVFALGAGKSITGIEHNKMIGQNWLDLFAPHEHQHLQNLCKDAAAGQRFGPEVIDLKSGLNMAKGLVGGIKMPGTKNFYLTLGLSNELMDRLSAAAEKKSPDPLLTDPKFKADAPFDDSAYGKGKVDADKFDDSAYGKSTLTEDKFNDSLYGKYGPPPDVPPGMFFSPQDFADNAERAFAFAQSQNVKADVTVFDFGRTESIPEKNWADIMGEMARLLRESAVDGQSAMRMENGCVSFIHGTGTDLTKLTEQMQQIIKDKAPGADIAIQSKTAAGDPSITPEEAAKALMYVTNEVAQKGAAAEVVSLQANLEKRSASNTDRLKELQTIIDRADFAIHYQPVVDLQKNEPLHYEMLSRFKQGEPLEWISFAEDVGLGPALDLVLVDRAFNYINFKSGGSRTKFSVNLSRTSLQNMKTFEKLKEKMEQNKKITERVVFEITRIHNIVDLNTTGKAIAAIKKIGFQIALDDYGAPDRAELFLEKLMPDYVKIDGKFVRAALANETEAKRIKNLIQTCKALGVKAIAEHIETAEQAAFMKAAGGTYGQGFFFGEPSAQLAFKPPSKSA